MSFTSFNLSRFNSTFKRAMAALGYATDSAIRARVLQEAQGSAVWARFAPSVAGYPSLPRVAGNIQIDESAALTALAGGVSDVLSYTAPDFKVGHTLPPLTSFAPGFFETTYLGSGAWEAKDGIGGIGGNLADDWGYCLDFARALGDTWAAGTFAAELANVNGQYGCRFKAVTDNPGRWKLSAVTRSLLSWEDSSDAEALFDDESGGGGAPVNYVIADSLISEGSADVMTPAGLVQITAPAGGVDYTQVFMRDADGHLVRQYGRALLRPYWCYAAADGGTSVAAAATKFADAETLLVTYMNAQLPVGNKLDVVRNGQEYQPAVRGSINLRAWSKNQSISDLDEYITNGGNCYRCITTGITENTVGAGPTGTGADITDGTVHWKYMGAETTTWRCDPEVKTWLATIDAYAATDPGRQAYLDQINGARLYSETALHSAIAAASPSTLYIYYGSMDSKEGYWSAASTVAANRKAGSQWGLYNDASYVITDFPSPELYRGYYPSWTFHGSNAATLPEQVTNAAGLGIATGTPLLYPFISGGWATSFSPPDYISYDDQWMGFCKFLYTCGAVGVDYGYYNSFPATGRTFDSSANRPIRHAVIVGHVHATFSHLEDYLRSGTLLEGDYDAAGLGVSSHQLCRNVGGGLSGYSTPSYEFVHDDDDQRYSKVVARKLNASNDWLICAWRCLDTGTDRTLSVTIAGHVLSVNARRGGTLYHMDNSGTLVMLDPLSMDPSRSIATILAGL